MAADVSMATATACVPDEELDEDEENSNAAGPDGDADAAAKRAAKNKAKKARAKANKAAAAAAAEKSAPRQDGATRRRRIHWPSVPPCLTPCVRVALFLTSGQAPGCDKRQGTQTEPPTVPVRVLFPSGIYPEGETQQYRDDNAYRTTATECRERERLEADLYNNVRQSAEVHRQVRKYVRTIAKPGVKLFDMCERLEDCVRRLIEEKGLEVCSQWVGAVCRGVKRSKGCRKIESLPVPVATD